MTTATRYLGTCPVCEGEYRLHRERMVHHGYRRPGHGSIEGDCPGVDYPPYEVSTKGTEAYVGPLQRQLPLLQEHLRQLQSGDITSLQQWVNRDLMWRGEKPVYRTLTTADGWEFRDELRKRTVDQERAVDSLQREVDRCEHLIRDWRPRPIRTLEEVVERDQGAKQQRADVRAQAKAVRDAKKQATRDKVAAREKREADFIERWRKELLAAARAGDLHRGKGDWLRMHREAKKQVSSMGRFLMGFVKEMKIDEALIDLGLASIDGNYLNYADETGWVMKPMARR